MSEVPEPIQTKPIGTEPIGTEHIQTEPIGTEPIETEPIETEPIETEPMSVDSKPAEHFSADPLSWGEDISPDKTGTLFKRVLRAGEGGDTPLMGDKVYVHYEGRLLDQSIFDSSKGNPVPFEVNIGLGQVIKGWDAGIITMRKGELCVLTCLPEMAYGGEEFQESIPPNSTLQFEIELSHWHGMYCTKDPGGHEVNVLKSFIREGNKHSAKVADAAEVTVHITGKYKDNVFFQREHFSFAIDECIDYDMPRGIEFGIKKMKKEEICKVYLPPDYGFGDAGNQELGIPPNASLVYEIHLLSFVNLKDAWEFDSVEERVEAATKFKTRGTALLTSDRVVLAHKSYEKGYGIVKLENLEEEEKAGTRGIRIALQLNISLCQSKACDFINQHRTCCQILEEDPDNLKAIFRRGMAGIEINEFTQSIADFNRVLEIEPENKGAVKLMDHAKLLLKEQTDKEKKLYASMFSKTFEDTQKNTTADAENPSDESESDPEPESVEL